MNSIRRYGAPWGTLLKVLSVLVTLALAWALAWVIVGRAATSLPWTLVAGLLGLGLVAGPLFMVRGFSVESGDLVVHRLGWQTRIPLHGLRSVEPVDLALGKCLRLFGNGGYWSFTGWFWNSRMGRFRLFANDSARAVALRFERRCVVVAPDDAEGLMGDLRRGAGLS